MPECANGANATPNPMSSKSAFSGAAGAAGAGSSASSSPVKQPRASGDRKTAALMRLEPDVIATGNIGCATQIGARAATPVVHTVELLDWATGGPVPAALSHLVSAGESRVGRHA